MGKVCIQYGGGVHTVWGRCAYSKGEVCILNVCVEVWWSFEHSIDVCIQWQGANTVWGRTLTISVYYLHCCRHTLA